jgi:predicted amino acid-binding ACT domain protein
LDLPRVWHDWQPESRQVQPDQRCDACERVLVLIEKAAPFGEANTMAFHIRRVDYFYTTVRDQPGEAYKVLTRLASLGINLVAVTAVPFGPMNTQLTIFPEDTAQLRNAAQKAGLKLEGPQPALLVQGDDELGAVSEVHSKLYAANVNIYASSGVADGKGHYGYVIYVRPDEYERAVAALNL